MHQKDKNKKSSSRKKKLKTNIKYEKRRDCLNQRLKNKSNYKFFFFFFFFSFFFFFFFFFFVVVSISDSKSFENQNNSKDSSLNSIFFDAKNNTKKSKIANLVTKTSSLSNNNAIIIEDLNNKDKIAYILKVFVLEDNNNLSIISSKSSLNRFILLEFIKFERSKTTKQSRKSIALVKFANNKKILKRSKQAYISVANNIDLDILQQTFSNYSN